MFQNLMDERVISILIKQKDSNLNFSLYNIQKSSLGENWPAVSGRLSKSSTSDLWRSSPDSYSGEYGVSTSVGSNSTSSKGSFKYEVYKQPLSLDRFFVHEVTPNEASMSKLDNAFVLVCLNRFQQIITVHTFQTESEQIKVKTKSNQNFLIKNVCCNIYVKY